MELDNKYSYDAAIRGFPLLLQMLVTKKNQKLYLSYENGNPEDVFAKKVAM